MKVKAEKVSVLIPAYNAAAFIGEAIESVLNQSWPNIEVIVIDDGSSDDTLAAASKYLSPTVTVITQSNGGASAARNRALSLATGRYIQYLDADDLLHPDKISLQIECLQRHTATVISSSAWAVFYQTPEQAEFRPSVLWRDYQDPTQWLIDAWESEAWMQPSAWMAHRSLIEAAGPWNESLSLHDDGEFFSRVLLASTGVVFCSDAKSYYRKGLSNSLSSIRSPKAVLSHLTVCELYEQSLLAQRNEPLTRQVCANNYQRLIYEYYPYYPAVRRTAQARIQGLGGSTAQAHATPLFKQVNRLIGWRLSKRLQNFVYRYKLNPASWRTTYHY